MTPPDDSSATTSGGASNIVVVPTHFDPEEVEDPSNPYTRPLLLASLPRPRDVDGRGKVVVDVLAYGGEDGCIHLLPGDGGGGGDDDDANKKPRTIRRYDDCVTALAASPDGKRVAVGFDDGSTRIYAYDDYKGDNSGAAHHHPFVPAGALADASGGDDDDDDSDGGGYLSQQPGDESHAGTWFEGPRADAPVRHLAFDPRSSGRGTNDETKRYFLAIASESGNRPLTVVDVSSETTAKTLYLEEKGEEEHEGGGARSVAYTAVADDDDGGDGNVFLASLDMKGKLVTWDVTSNDPLFWDCCRKDFTKHVSKDDGGEGCNDAGDKACALLWDSFKGGKKGGRSVAALFLPGQSSVQYKLCPLSKSSGGGGGAEPLTTSEAEGHFAKPVKFVADGDGKGHGDDIVAMALLPSDDGGGNGNSGNVRRLATGGRDGKLFLWDLDLEEGTGSAREMALTRRPETHGIPPVTSVLWAKEDGRLRVAFADGTVRVVPAAAATCVTSKRCDADAIDDRRLPRVCTVLRRDEDAMGRRSVLKVTGGRSHGRRKTHGIADD